MNKKLCTKCNRIKLLSLFTKRSGSSDGYRGQCKECRNEANRDNYRKNKESLNARRRELHAKDPYKYQETRAKYNRSEKGKAVAKKSAEKFLSTERGRNLTKQAHKKYAENNRNKIRTHWRIKQRIKSGAMVRGVCEKCGDSDDVHAHHDDYNKPLDVRWLCRKHHSEFHRRIK